MSTLGKSNQGAGRSRAGETLTATARTPKEERGIIVNVKIREEDRRPTTTGKELWRHQPLKDWWVQWNEEQSERLREHIQSSNNTWSRGAPYFTVTNQGMVSMNWGGMQQVPLLVVDQLRGDADDIRPPPHPAYTFSIRKRKWLLNLTMLTMAMPGVEVDFGYLFDYRKALRMVTIGACSVMHKPHPKNHHTKVAMWELEQEPQPQPGTSDHVVFEEHRKKRLEMAKKAHRLYERHQGDYLRKWRQRAQALSEQETAQILDSMDASETGRTQYRRTSWTAEGTADRIGDGTGDQPTSTPMPRKRLRTHKEEAETSAWPLRQWIATREMAASAHPEQAEEEEEKLGPEGGKGNGCSKERTELAQARRAAVDFRREERLKLQRLKVHTHQRSGNAPTIEWTVARPRDDTRLTAMALSGGSKADGEMALETTGGQREEEPAVGCDRTAPTQPPPPHRYLPGAEPEISDGEAMEAVDHGRLTDRRLERGDANPPAALSLPRIWGPLQMGIDNEAKQLHPSVNPRAMENLLKAVDQAIQCEAGLRRITTKEEWERSAAAGDLERLGTEVARSIGTQGEGFAWTRWKGEQKMHFAQTVVEETVRRLTREHKLREQLKDDSASFDPQAEKGSGAERRGEPVESSREKGRWHLTQSLHEAGSDLAQKVAEDIAQELQEEAKANGTADTEHGREEIALEPMQSVGNLRGRENKELSAQGADATRTESGRHELKESARCGNPAEGTEDAPPTEMEPMELEGKLSTSSHGEGTKVRVGFTLPRELAGLLERATEAFWQGLSERAVKIVLYEVEQIINTSVVLRDLGPNKNLWRTQSAQAAVGTMGGRLHTSLRRHGCFNDQCSDEYMDLADFRGQEIIDVVWTTWLREARTPTQGTTETDQPKGEETSVTNAQQAGWEQLQEWKAADEVSGPARNADNKAPEMQLRRSRGGDGALLREGIYIMEDGTRVRGKVQTSRLPADAAANPEEWNGHLHICQRGCEMLPPMTPIRIKTKLERGESRAFSFHVDGERAAAGVLFMGDRGAVRGAKLAGHTIEGVAVQANRRGKGIGTLLMQVALEEAMRDNTELETGEETTVVNITVQKALFPWVYRRGFSRNVEGRLVSWGADSESFYWRPDKLNLRSTADWKWTARPMVNPDSLCQLVSVVQTLLASDTFMCRLFATTWPDWKAGDTLIRLAMRPKDPGIEEPMQRFRGIQDQRQLSRELIMRLFHVLNGKGGEERRISEEQDASEMFTNLSRELDAEQAGQLPTHQKGLQPTWTEEMWGVTMTSTRRCDDCQIESPLHTSRETELRPAAADIDLYLEAQLRDMTETTEEMTGNRGECGHTGTWQKGLQIEDTGELLAVHINRHHPAGESFRLSGRMHCPKVLTLQTRRGPEEFRLVSIIIHTGEGTRVTLDSGEHVWQFRHGHYVATVHRTVKGKDRVCLLDDSAKVYDAPHPEEYGKLDMIQTEGGGVESLALYQKVRTRTGAATRAGDEQQIRLDLARMGVTARDCQQRGPGGMTEKGGEKHDLCEPKAWIVSRNVRDSLQAWGRVLIRNAGDLPMAEEASKEEMRCTLAEKERALQTSERDSHGTRQWVQELSSVMQKRRLWRYVTVSLVTTGHYREPLTSGLPMVAWCGEAHSMKTDQAGHSFQTGLTLLFVSRESLRHAGLETEDGEVTTTYELLMSRLQAVGKENGMGVQCRIMRLTPTTPIATWPGDWNVYVIGDAALNEKGEYCPLLVTAWRPENRLRTDDAMDAFHKAKNKGAKSILEQLRFPTPTGRTALTWLQDGTEQWEKDELDFQAALDRAAARSKERSAIAKPVEEPKKRAAP